MPVEQAEAVAVPRRQLSRSTRIIRAAIIIFTVVVLVAVAYATVWVAMPQAYTGPTVCRPDPIPPRGFAHCDWHHARRSVARVSGRAWVAFGWANSPAGCCVLDTGWLPHSAWEGDTVSNLTRRWVWVVVWDYS